MVPECALCWVLDIIETGKDAIRVLKTKGPLWLQLTLRHLILRVPRWDANFGN